MDELVAWVHKAMRDGKDVAGYELELKTTVSKATFDTLTAKLFLPNCTLDMFGNGFRYTMASGSECNSVQGCDGYKCITHVSVMSKKRLDKIASSNIRGTTNVEIIVTPSTQCPHARIPTLIARQTKDTYFREKSRWSIMHDKYPVQLDLTRVRGRRGAEEVKEGDDTSYATTYEVELEWCPQNTYITACSASAFVSLFASFMSHLSVETFRTDGI